MGVGRGWVGQSRLKRQRVSNAGHSIVGLGKLGSRKGQTSRGFSVEAREGRGCLAMTPMYHHHQLIAPIYHACHVFITISASPAASRARLATTLIRRVRAGQIVPVRELHRLWRVQAHPQPQIKGASLKVTMLTSSCVRKTAQIPLVFLSTGSASLSSHIVIGTGA